LKNTLKKNQTPNSVILSALTVRKFCIRESDDSSNNKLSGKSGFIKEKRVYNN
jgi:hypothetical protein